MWLGLHEESQWTSLGLSAWNVQDDDVWLHGNTKRFYSHAPRSWELMWREDALMCS